MIALRLHAAGDLRLHEEPDPTPADGEELVRVTAVGLCGSDRHWYVEGGIGDASLDHPLVLGHEAAGVIAEGDRAGTRVVLDPADPCNECEQCRSGSAHLCPRMRFLGHGGTDGAMRTVMGWPRHLAHLLPDSIPDVEAALLEPLGVALHAVELAQLRPGMSAGVFGCGPIGLLVLQVLRALDCRAAVATDPLGHRLEAARAMGARVAKVPGGELPAVDVAFEVAGTDGAVGDAIRAVRAGGRVVLVGIPDGDRTSFQASMARRKELSIVLCRRMSADDLRRAIELAAAGTIHLAPLISERRRLEDGDAAFASLAARRGLKVIVEPGGANVASR